MTRFVLHRVLQAVPTIVGITIVGFLLVHLVPGDPGRIQLGPRASESAVRAFDRQLGLTRPLIAQYWSFVRGAASLNFGQSPSQHESVGAVLRSHAAPSVLLIGYSLALSLALAIPFAIAVARRPNGKLDQVVRGVGMVAFAMPAFWLALFLVLTLGLGLGLFPVSGYQGGLLGTIRTLTLPSLTLALAMAPFFIRTLRASLIVSMGSGYVEAARARGLSERRVLYRHALRPSSIALVTLVGLQIAYLISWTVVVENVFGIPGLGSVLVTAVTARDFPLVQGMIVVLGAAVVVISLLTDVVYAFVDPRVQV